MISAHKQNYMKIKTTSGVFIAVVLFLSLFLFAFFTKPFVAMAEETDVFSGDSLPDAAATTMVADEVVPDSAFKVIDEFRDEADLGNGRKRLRIYTKPRLIYEDNGIKHVRAKGWNLFNENESKLSKLDFGYDYIVNSVRNESIRVKAGKMEYDSSKILRRPVTTGVNKFDDDGATAVELLGVYPNIDIKFRDIGSKREKKIIINKKLEGLKSGENVIFWETINFPKGALVFESDKQLKSGRTENISKLVSIQTPNGDKLIITPALIFDSTVISDSDFDLKSKPLNYLVEVDYKNSILRLGIVVKTDYLLDASRVYPVTIDPYYYACQKGATGTTVSCSIIDGYFRQYMGATDVMYYTQTTLFTGYSDTDKATRQIFLDFNLSSLPNYTVDKAFLYMKYKNFGTGTYTSDVGLMAKQLNQSVNILNTNYFNIRSYLSSMGSEVPVSKTGYDVWYKWTVTPIVKTFNSLGGPFDIIVEPTNAWLSGTYPNWPKRLSVFYAQEDTGNNGPYLEIDMTPKLPDLTKVSGGSTISGTTVKPGDTIDISIQVANEGEGSANASHVYYYFKKDSYAFDNSYKVGSDYVSSLSPSNYSSEDFSYTVPSNTAPGTYYLSYWVDAEEVISESSESNNKFYWTITVSAQSDLTLDSSGATVNKYTFTPGETMNIGVPVKNIDTAAPGKSSYVYYYFKKDSQVFSDTYKIGQSIISNLSPGSVYPTGLNYTIPAGTPVGTYYLYFWIDGGQEVAESNESNNAYNFTQTITVSAPVDPLEPNDTYSQAYNIGSNTGYTNNNLVLTSGDQDWFKFTYDSKTYYFKVRGYSASVAGNYGISFSRSGSTVTMQTTKVDNNVDTYLEWYGSNPTGSYIGDDDSGNPSPFSKLVVIITSADYDFSPLNFSITNTGVHYSGNNDTVAVSGQIKNTGSVSASGISYQLNLISGAQKYNLSGLNPSSLSISSGETKNVTLTGVIPGGMPYYDTYQVEVILDADSSFTETNETNNTTLTSNTVPVQQWSGVGGGGGGGGPAPVDSIPAVASIPIGLKPNGAIPVADEANHSKNYSINSDQTGNTYGADPVNIRNGAFEFEQTDFVLFGRGFPIKISRVYNSKAAERNERFGAGWTSSNHLYYFQDPTTKEVQIYLGGALVSYFTTPDSGATFVAEKGDFNTLHNENNYLVYKTIDGIKYKLALKLIDNIGMIDSVVDTNNNITQFGYILKNGVKLLSTITDPSGRSVQFVYPTSDTDTGWDKVKEIRENLTGASRLIAGYTYDSNNNLIQVHRENFYQSEPTVSLDSYYSYDSSNLLLDYTDARGTVLYNEYDSSGRVIKQYEKNPDLGSSDKRLIYEISYQDSADPAVPESAHCTVTKNYRAAGDYYSETFCFNADELKIYRERGADIERWSYDALGMVSAYTDGDNNAANYEFDAKRRVIKETMPDTSWHTVNTFEYENTFNRLTKKTETVSAAAAPAALVEVKTSNFTYDSSGNLIIAVDALDNVEKREYNANGTIKKYINKLDQTIDYIYDGTGNYIAKESAVVVQADNITQIIAKNYGYDAYGHKISYTDPRDLVYTYGYDYRGNLRQETNPIGGSKYYSYDKEDHRISETNELGRVVNYTFAADINASLLKIEKLGDGGPIVYERQYDWLGDLVKEIDPLGMSTALGYDSANRVSSKIDPIKTVNYEYYGNGKLKKETNTGGARADYFYDARGNNTEVRRYYDASNYIANKFEYDGFSRRVKEIDGKNYAATYDYDLMDRVAQTTDPIGNITQYFYDANGNKTGEITPLAFADAGLKNNFGHSNTYVYDGVNRAIKKINADDKYILYFYDAGGNLISSIDRQNSDGTQNSHVNSYQYDSLNRRIKATDGLNGFTSSTYDAVGNMLSKTDQMGRTWNYTYDPFNRLTDEYDPANNNIHYTYDKAGNKKSVTDLQDKTTQFQYDSLNRLIKAIDPLDNYEEYSYDLLNNKTSAKDKNGNSTVYVYDKLSRLASETNPQNTVISYTYDANSNRLTENIAGKTTSYEYDELNRSKKRIEPGNKVFTFGYDANSNKVSEVNANSETISYVYDKLDRLAKKTLPEGVVSYGYDQWDNLTSLSDLSGAANYTYDVLNRNINEARTINGLFGSFNVAREYFADSAQKSITDAANKKVNYNYNNRGLIDSVAYSASNLAVYTYTSFGKPLTVTYGNGVITTYTYDELQRPKSVETKLGSNVLFKQEYSYDKDSNRTQMVEYKLINGKMAASTVNYAYDSINQVTNADYAHLPANRDLTYNYDAWGNRTNYHNAFGTSTYTYTANTNEIVGLSLNNRLNIAYSTDNNGNITKEIYNLLGKNTKTINYDWNSENKLNSITYQIPNQTNNVLSFAYDDFGNRVKKSVNGGNSYYLNNGLTVLNELDATGAVTKTIVNGLNQIAEIDKDNNILYVNQDILGSAALLTNNTGVIVHQYSYDPFGNLASELGEEDKDTKYLYTNQEFDPESDLYYYNARYYNPLLGRFLSKDPIIHRADGVLGFNEYIYVKNNPLRYVDPSGRVNWDLLWEGTKQTVMGGLNTAFGALEVVGGFALATGGTVASGGLAAAPAIVGGAAIGTMGANNVVAGVTEASGGVTNIWNSFFDEEKKSVDYTFNPAHEAIDATTEKGSTLNTVLSVGYDVADVIAGGKAISTAMKGLTKTVKIVDTENVLLKASGGAKPDLSLLSKSGEWRVHLGYHPWSQSVESAWHIGLGVANKVHIPAKPLLYGASILKGVYSYESNKFDDK